MLFTSFLSLWLSLATAANSIYTPCKLCIYEASPNELAKLELRLYTGSTVDNYTSVQAGHVLDLFELMDNSKPTAMFIFGWLGTPDLPSYQVIVKAFLDRGDHNFLILDWQRISISEYTYVVRSVEGVGYTLATALSSLVAAGLNPAGVHIIGHSLGAQISGYTGRYVNFTLTRITGLDPANFGFWFINQHLSSADAKFVEIIHTDRGFFGLNLQTGDADFYPNNGVSVQPGCLIGLDLCSHYRACYLYADSVQYENSFIGLSCDSYSNFEAGLCSSNPTAVMGYGTPTNASGRYYLRTNSESPFGKGKEGTM